MSNSSRSDLRSRLKNLLNATSGDDFWTDAVLNELLQNSVKKYFRKYQGMAEDFGVREYTMTYPGATDNEVCCYGKLSVDDGSGFSVGETITGGTSTATAQVLKTSTSFLWVDTVSGTFSAAETVTGGTSSATATVGAAVVTDIFGENFPDINRISSIVVDTTAGYLELVEAECLHDIIEGYTTDHTVTYPEKWFFHKEIVVTSGNVTTMVPKLFLRFMPTSSVTLRIYVQAEPPNLSADTATTGMPDYVEDCVVYDSGHVARLIEENTQQIGVMKSFLSSAEQELIRRAGESVGSDQIRLSDYDLL